jgi:hypothetical protein
LKFNKYNFSIIIGLFSISWLLTVFVGYGYVHKPFLPEELIGGLQVIWRTLIAIVILSLAGGIGMSINLRQPDFSPLVKSVIACALGMGIISISMLVFATTIGINFSLWIILLVVIFIFRKSILLWLKSFQELKSFWQGTGKTGRVAIFLILVILACQYFEALAPPLQFDALTYHLAIPGAYLQNGHLTYLQDNTFWGMPQLVEMLYTLAMYAGGTEAAPILGWWAGCLALIGLAGFAKEIFETETAWIAIASIMAGSGLTTSISSGYVEWVSVLYGLSTLIFLSRWLEDKKISTLRISGIFAGMALGTKYTNGIIIIGSVIVVLLLQKFVSFKRLLINLLWFGGMAAMAMLPWLIKNTLATLNPFYPLFIPGGAMDATLLSLLQFKPFTQDWSRIILLPWQVTIWGVDGGNGYSASIGPLLLGLSPFAFIHWNSMDQNRKALLKTSLGILLVGFFVWAIGSQFRGLLIQTRLYFVIFPAWALLAVAGYLSISKINSHNIRFRKPVNTFILLALLFNTFYTIKAITVSNPMAVILRLESRESYIARNLGGYETAMQVIQSLKGNPKVLMLWETRSLECQPICDPDEIIGRWYHDWTIYQDGSSIISSWKKLGYTYVLLNRNGADFVRKYDTNAPGVEYWLGLQKTLKALILVETNMGGYELYQLP